MTTETHTGALHQTGSRREAQITAPDGQPVIEIVREFDAPVERVFRAHVDPELVVQWLGPRRLRMRLEQWDMRRGGSYRYVHVDEDGSEYGFHGVFHEVRPHDRIVQTFTYEGWPDSVSLEKATFADLGGRTRVTTTSVFDSVEGRDVMVASGMESGLNEGYSRLDELLAGAGS